MSALDVEGLLRRLSEASVECVLIGAVALAAHGPVRATEDLGLVPDPDPENLRRLGNLLVELDARLPLADGRPFGTEERAALARGRSLTVDTRLGGLDVVQRTAGVPSYEELASEALTLEPFGIPARVCSRRHLRGMKLARGAHRDLADVEDLDAIPE